MIFDTQIGTQLFSALGVPILLCCVNLNKQFRNMRVASSVELGPYFHCDGSIPCLIGSVRLETSFAMSTFLL